MSSGAAAHSVADFTERQVEIVMHENALFGAKRHTVRKSLQPDAGKVHGHLNLEQTHTSAVRCATCDQHFRGGIPFKSARCSESVKDFITHVMWRSGVSGFGIAKSYDHLFIGLNRVRAG